jgi:hypothetical protein
MTSNESQQGTLSAPAYHDGPVDTHGDIRQHQRYFTYHTEAGLVSGTATNVTFTIEGLPREVWPYFKDFNLWQSAHHYYSGVLGELYFSAEGDLGREDFRLSAAPNSPPYPNQYQILRVIPEHAIVVFQPVPKDGSNGGVSRGFHVFMLTEHDGKTIVTVLMEHATRTQDKTEAEALAYWREMVPGWRRKWLDDFIPTLKGLIHQARQK